MRFIQRPRRRPVIEIAPMVDVVFLLIIFFAVSTTFREGTGLPVTLPSAGTAAAHAAAPVEVTIAQGGRVQVGDEIFPTPSSAESAISRALDASENRSIVVRGDRKTEYEAIVEVLDIARRLDARGIELATRRPLSQAQP